jgi:hypothetical protein
MPSDSGGHSTGATESLPVHKLKDVCMTNMLEVYETSCEENGLHQYIAVRAQKRNLSKLCPRRRRLIFTTPTPNAVNEWNCFKERFRDFNRSKRLSNFIIKGNVIRCHMAAEKFRELLELSFSERKIVEEDEVTDT